MFVSISTVFVICWLAPTSQIHPLLVLTLPFHFIEPSLVKLVSFIFHDYHVKKKSKGMAERKGEKKCDNSSDKYGL
jgi:hypothetical protein